MKTILIDLHSNIIDKVNKFSNPNYKWDANYYGTNHILLGLTAKNRDKIVRWLLNEYKDVINCELLDLLYQGKYYAEKSIAGQLIKRSAKLRKQIKLSQFYNWLGLLSGWAEVDSGCQSTFTSVDLLSNWSDWKPFLNKLNSDQNISRRRASLVLLTGPVSSVDSLQLSDISFTNIDKLINEKDILITKAVSWLLRSLIKYHRNKVENYIEKNRTLLPAIAYRETRRKLDTGRK